MFYGDCGYYALKAHCIWGYKMFIIHKSLLDLWFGWLYILFELTVNNIDYSAILTFFFQIDRIL